MSWDGNGTFLRVMNWASDAANNIKIKSDRHDIQDDDFANGLSNTITKDGQSQPVNDIPMNDHRIINLADPVNDQDAVTKAYADTIRPSSSGMEISGADANGRLTFSSLTGVNGIAWAGADLSWIARLAVAELPGPPVVPAVPARLCLNDRPDGSGNDVAIFYDDGSAKLLKDLTITGTFTGNFIAATGTIKGASAALNIVPTSGNGHIWWLAADGVAQRAVMYTSGGAQGNLIVTVGSATYQYTPGGAFYVGSSYHGTDGNLVGSIWSNWGASDAYGAIGARIEARATAWANDRIANLQYRKVSRGSTGGLTDGDCPAGAVITGYRRDAGNQGQVYNLYYKYLQIYDPVRGWVGFSEA
jgi:hypothetical protein